MLISYGFNFHISHVLREQLQLDAKMLCPSVQEQQSKVVYKPAPQSIK